MLGSCQCEHVANTGKITEVRLDWSTLTPDCTQNADYPVNLNAADLGSNLGVAEQIGLCEAQELGDSFGVPKDGSLALNP